MLLLNLLVVGGGQVALFALQQQSVERQQGHNLGAALVSALLAVYSGERFDREIDAEVRDLVRQGPALTEYFQDVVVSSGRPPSGLLFVNTRGAVHRDPDTFDHDAIQRGMVAAAASPGIVPAAGGYCCAVRSPDGVVGQIWFVPLEVAPATLPVWYLVATVLLGTLLFGLSLSFVVVRAIGRPLRRIGGAAEKVGAGDYDVRVPPLRGAPELDALVRSFNAMAEKVQGNRLDLEQAVRAAVEEAKRSERALVQSSRLATVGTLAAGIAHEINNPIGGMQNAVVRLLADSSLSPKQRQYLGLVQDGLQRVAKTARKVLDFAPRAVVAQPFALRAAIEGARALCEHRAAQLGCVFAIDVPKDLPAVFGDHHEIQQVVLNLFLNSLDAFEQSKHKGRIAVTARAAGEVVRLCVEDDGPGMDSKDLPRVMDPFWSKKDRPDASGLGMFISYSIIRNHGGAMTVDSEVGKGFRTVITLPRSGG